MNHEQFMEKLFSDNKRRTLLRYSSQVKIRNVIEEMRGETSIAKLFRREVITQTCIIGGSKILWYLLEPLNRASSEKSISLCS